jgi:hypothetical protein
MYGAYCDIISKDGDSHMNARATLSNCRTVKENGDGTIVVQAMQDNFEVALEI